MKAMRNNYQKVGFVKHDVIFEIGNMWCTILGHIKTTITLSLPFVFQAMWCSRIDMFSRMVVWGILILAASVVAQVPKQSRLTDQTSWNGERLDEIQNTNGVYAALALITDLNDLVMYGGSRHVNLQELRLRRVDAKI